MKFLSKELFESRQLKIFSGFFHPYGEIVNIQIIPVGQKFPEECHKFIDTVEFEESFCAIVEFLTARVAKFVVGVLRKRIEGLNFRIGLLKPGLAEEMVVQDSVTNKTFLTTLISTKSIG